MEMLKTLYESVNFKVSLRRAGLFIESKKKNAHGVLVPRTEPNFLTYFEIFLNPIDDIERETLSKKLYRV